MTASVTQKIPSGYKQTEIGLYPIDWEVKNLGELLKQNPKYGINAPAVKYSDNLPTYIRITDISDDGRFLSANKTSVDHFLADKYYLENDDLVFARTGASVGKTFLYNTADGELVYAGFLIRVQPDPDKLNSKYLSNFTRTKGYWNWVQVMSMRSGQPGINGNEYKQLLIPLPPTLFEQCTIATVLTDADNLIEKLEKLIEKKKNIKQGTMQELLTGKRRLPGFNGEWLIRTIEETTECLDNLRVPLNENQRSKMQGDIPYCGANGILDYVNNYVIDDDIILIAEDGGYFDEYSYRPIAYRMIGKCWVNNHAHILKAKNSYDQGFIYYSLVHKNILQFLANGTRAKLNKSEMYKIEIDIAPTKPEQTAIATVLSDMDLEIEKLESQLTKYKNLKQGMMQKLLTGKIRLIKK